MEKTTSIVNVGNRIMRHPLMKDIPFETILAYTVDFIQIVGIPELYDEKTAVLEVKDWRAPLPCDYIEMIQVRLLNNENPPITYRYASNSFHMSDNHDGPVDLTYKIQRSIIYTSNKEGTIEIAYRAIAVDDEGYPLLPDNPSFLRALELYIKKQWFTILFDLNRIQMYVLNQTLQEYAWAVGSATADLNTLSIDKAENLFNSWKTLIIRDQEHDYGFLNTGAKEFIRNH